MIVKLLTEHHLEFLSLKGGCTGSSESTLVKMPHGWKSHVAAHMVCASVRGYTPIALALVSTCTFCIARYLMLNAVILAKGAIMTHRKRVHKGVDSFHLLCLFITQTCMTQNAFWSWTAPKLNPSTPFIFLPRKKKPANDY